jgi:hypothetical protein
VAAETGDWQQVAYRKKEVAARGWTSGMGSPFVGAPFGGGAKWLVGEVRRLGVVVNTAAAASGMQ